MTISHRAAALAVPLALAATLMLAGCASSGEPAASPAANSPETARAYAACLTGEGIEGVFVDDNGFVGIQFTASGDEQGTSEGGTVFVDASDDSVNTAAEEHCTAEVPDYRAEVFDTDPAQAAQLLSQSREFAACARLNGLTDFADPDAGSGAKLVVPEGTTKPAFVAVVTACATTFAPADPTGPPADDTEGADGNGVSFTMMMPEFGGAYTKEWASDVTTAFFNALQPAQGVAP